jgi:peptide/nickel transport system permease protein
VKSLIKNPFFITGFMYIIGLFSFSLYHYFIMENNIPQTSIKYAEDGLTLIGRPPFSPSSEFWFGTDQHGADLFYKIIAGGKFTLGLAFLIGFIRVGLSFVFGTFFSMIGKPLKWIKGIVDSFHYFPSALLAYFVLNPIIYSNDYSFYEKAIFEIVILTLIAIPTTSILIDEEIRLIKRNNFIVNAKIMGGSRYYVFFKHILPHLSPKIVLMYIQQVIVVLVLLVHLGVLKIFFGGTSYRELEVQGESLAVSISNEWSGLIGGFYYQLSLAPWLILFPTLFFAITILAMNFIYLGIKQSYTKPSKVKSKNNVSDQQQSSPSIHKTSFVKVNKNTIAN